MSIYSKLLEIQKLNIKITPDAENPYYHSKYATLENIRDIVLPEFNKRDILWSDSVQDSVVVSQLVDTEDGTLLESKFPLDRTLNAQQRGAEVSYARRYNISSLLTLVTDTDDDGNGAIPVASVSTKAPVQYSSAPKTFSRYNQEPTKWLSEFEIDKMLEEMKTGNSRKYLSSESMIKDLRAENLGVSKKLADYIGTKFKKNFDAIPF